MPPSRNLSTIDVHYDSIIDPIFDEGYSLDFEWCSKKVYGEFQTARKKMEISVIEIKKRGNRYGRSWMSASIT